MVRAAWIYYPEFVTEGEIWGTPGTGWRDSLSRGEGMSREVRRVMGVVHTGLWMPHRDVEGRGWQWVGSEGLNMEGHTCLVLL